MTIAEVGAATATASATHQAAQAAIATQVAATLPALWSAYVDENELQATLPTYTGAVAAIVRRYGLASAALAAHFYESQRKDAGVPGSFRVKPAPPAPLEQVSKSVDWATKGLWSKTPNVEASQTLVTGAAERLALDPGRATIIQATHADRKSTGWAREIEPGACSFCILLATRGAVYRTERSADFRSHDHCRCHVDPLFGPYEPSADLRRYMALYQQTKRTPGVRGPTATRRAFRQAVEADRSKS